MDSRIHRFDPAFRWDGVPVAEYKQPASHWCGIARQVLIGERGEQTAFQMRYFEIAPGGFSSLESHAHEHAVLVLRGRVTWTRFKMNWLFVVATKTTRSLPSSLDAGHLLPVERERAAQLKQARLGVRDRLGIDLELVGDFLGHVHGVGLAGDELHARLGGRGRPLGAGRRLGPRAHQRQPEQNASRQRSLARGRSGRSV